MNLAQRREHIGASQQWVADEAGVSRSAVAMVERGDRRPSVDMMGDLARALGITLDQFMQSWRLSNGQ